MADYIKKADCQTGGFYRLDSRNLVSGIWNGHSFEGIREKFGTRYISEEDHWDDGPPHGTAKPLKLICVRDPVWTIFVENEIKFDWIDKQDKEYMAQ